DEHHTMRILEVLSGYGVTASFFVLAQRAARFPEIVAAIRGAGHEIALHGDDHSPLVGCSTREKVARIRRGKRRLDTLLEAPVRFFRPPYGWQDVRAFLAARALRLDVVGWTADGEDWLDLTPTEVADRAEAGITQGSILLLHDRSEPLPTQRHETPGASLDRARMVEELLLRAARRRVRFVSLGILLSHGVPVRRPWFWRPLSEVGDAVAH
ncbi:MAG: polysaccharide deacetylase family protein, partial [bacterium]